MRVVAGEAKGRRLVAPPGRSTRPTSDRVREAIFDVLNSLGGVEAARVADLFAGSGALGIEALSRHAAHAVFVDHDRAAVAAVRANLESTGFDAGRALVVRADVLRWLAAAEPVDLVLCDPPYQWPGWAALMDRIAGVVAPSGGLVVLESGEDLDVGGDWRVVTAKRYGGSVVTIVRPAAKGGT